jgi:uncharacterized cofD-like protein
MKSFKWLYPGMNVKRWIALCAFGVIMVSVGFVLVITEESSSGQSGGSIIIILGILSVITGIKRIIKSFMEIFQERGEGLVDRIYQKRVLEKGPRVVAVGGGTGLSTLLRGLKEYTSNITAIVTVADDGGSSGRLRKEFDVLPPGDIRNCIVALADSETLVGKLFQFRFTEGDGLKGHNFGNLFITALSQVTGDFQKAVKESSAVLAIRGKVVPSTLDNVFLVAEHSDGSETFGESKIPDRKSPIKRMMLKSSGQLDKNGITPTKEAIDAIRKADAIVLGPGSLYTSVIPNLLVKDLHDEIIKSKAIKIYICNVMTQSGETDNYSASEHVKAVIEHTGKGIVDFCLVNSSVIPGDMLDRYKSEKSFPVAPDVDNIKRLGCDPKLNDLISATNFVRHDSHKVANAVMRIISEESAAWE